MRQPFLVFNLLEIINGKNRIHTSLGLEIRYIPAKHHENRLRRLALIERERQTDKHTDEISNALPKTETLLRSVNSR